jgi:L-histidine Nalpha-methyltransferase
VSSILEAVDATALAAREGLSAAQKTLPPWLFYDEAGSQLFEQITELPEYYLTRTERAIFEQYADQILLIPPAVTIVELGAGTASKTGILLREAVKYQDEVVYQPIDISPSALEEARDNIVVDLPRVTVRTQVANYITEPYRIQRRRGENVLALYIGSSIGNFSPEEARGILLNLRRHLEPGDSLLLGTDLAPSAKKPVEALLAAYNDAQGVTAAFNLNILTRLNRELGANFNSDCFSHQARWNAVESRIEMHLVAAHAQTVRIPANSAGPTLTVHFEEGETIHTENSYKFTQTTIADLLTPTGFVTSETFEDPSHLFAITLAEAV